MREIIVLHYFESVPIARMAAVLRISQDAVNFTLGWNDASLSTSSDNKILFEVQNGGVMTNVGPVALGVHLSGQVSRPKDASGTKNTCGEF